MPDFLTPLLNAWPGILALLAIGIVVRVLKSPKVKGWMGERSVRKALDRLEPANYRAFHDLYLPRPDGNGTTQVDHAVVSRFGVFVIETKNYEGWIFGSERQRQWTQQIYRRKNRFQNPLHQNLLHCKEKRRSAGRRR